MTDTLQWIILGLLSVLIVALAWLHLRALETFQQILDWIARHQ